MDGRRYRYGERRLYYYVIAPHARERVGILMPAHNLTPLLPLRQASQRLPFALQPVNRLRLPAVFVHRETLVNRYYGFLSLFPHLEWVAPDLAAIRCGAAALLTNGADLTRVSQLEVGILDRLR